MHSAVARMVAGTMVAELEKSRQSRMDLEVEPIGLAARLNMGVERKVRN